jgi:hypothetical protein
MDAPLPPLHRARPSRRPLGRRLGALLLIAMLAPVLTGGCGKHEPVLEDLKSLDDFKARFNDDEGKPRIVLLLSPT